MTWLSRLSLAASADYDKYVFDSQGSTDINSAVNVSALFFYPHGGVLVKKKTCKFCISSQHVVMCSLQLFLNPANAFAIFEQ